MKLQKRPLQASNKNTMSVPGLTGFRLTSISTEGCIAVAIRTRTPADPVVRAFHPAGALSIPETSVANRNLTEESAETGHTVHWSEDQSRKKNVGKELLPTHDWAHRRN